VTEGKGRAGLQSILREATAEDRSTVGVIACGPAGMVFDVRSGTRCAEA
jgi:hypothetical protein